MCKALADTLGWVQPSKRLANTVERAQKYAHNAGVREILPEHFFSAILEDLDAIYFLGRYGLPLERLETLKCSVIPAAPQAMPNVLRLAAPAHYNSKPPATPPHLEILASAAVRRIMCLASALAERRSMAEAHGGVVLEAILEDGRSEAARALKSLYEEMAGHNGYRQAMLPGAGYEGALIAIQAPAKEEPKVPPPPPPQPRKQGLSSLDQVRWMRNQIERSLEQEHCYRLLRELNTLAGANSSMTNMALLQLREEAQFELSANPVFRASRELELAEEAVLGADNRVRAAAVHVAEAKPEIFKGLLPLVEDAAATGLKAGLETRRAELAAAAAAAQEAKAAREAAAAAEARVAREAAAAEEAWAAREAEAALVALEAEPVHPLTPQQYLVQVETKGTALSVVKAAWSDFAASTKVPVQDHASLGMIKKSFAAPFVKLKGSVAAARATMMNLFA